MSIEEKKKLAHRVIDNSRSVSDTKSQVEKILDEYGIGGIRMVKPVQEVNPMALVIFICFLPVCFYIGKQPLAETKEISIGI